MNFEESRNRLISMFVFCMEYPWTYYLFAQAYKAMNEEIKNYGRN